MIRRITLVDFMAHSRTELELAPGLNVLCGPNNTGKSAVVEALRCLTSNPAPRHVIRHGAKEARVEALLDDGRRVAWVRRKNHALYEVYEPGTEVPEVYAKLGKSGVPPEVAAVLRLSPVTFEKGESVDVHLAGQRQPIFLLDQPGSLLADFLASSTESAHLMAMQDLLREKTRRAKTVARDLETGLARVRRGLDGLRGLPALALGLETLREERRILEARQAEPRALEALAGRLEALALARGRLSARLETLSRLAAPPAPAPCAGLDALLEGLTRLSARKDAARRALAALAPLDAPPRPAPTGELAGLLARLEAARAARARASRRAGLLVGLPAPPDVADPAPLAALAGSLETLRARVEKGRAWLARRERELEALAARVAARLEQAGECPLCGSAMDLERFLRREGTRGTA
ncbi:Chromosome partition protein Smc [Fundidesulfovibrio magnetotacticus]|uniref:DNA repair protein RecN n=1 Tax=Fundidesulfovibrio magnetotacticus TaxID=2730080 RepID=A0A6V8LS09_9BACT|nr:AAA family ATPase [Fundidesulfovibrio magnetotacticus]GFK93108.1 Chromosome partition protein Smc [Fundidesulfovibrio magnetotacticus]